MAFWREQTMLSCKHVFAAIVSFEIKKNFLEYYSVILIYDYFGSAHVLEFNLRKLT